MEERNSKRSCVQVDEARDHETSPGFYINKFNPLNIIGHEIFEKDYRDSSVHNSIYKMVLDSIACTSDPLLLNITFQIGKITSISQSKCIILPIETDCVLDYDYNKLQFIPNISTSCLDVLYMSIFTSKTTDIKLLPYQDYLELELVTLSNINEGINHSRIYKVSYNNDNLIDLSKITCYTNNLVNENFIYCPQSNYHYRVAIQSTTDLNPLMTSFDDEKLIKIIFRSIKVYKVNKKVQIKCVEFKLQVIDQWEVIVNNELSNMNVTELFNLFFNTFILKNNIQHIDVDTAEDTRIKIIQIVNDYKQLYKQYDRMLQYKINRFDFIISMLQANINVIIRSFNSTDGYNDNDYYPNLFGDVSEYAQIHYDTRKFVRQQLSTIESLRKNNNFIKRILIALYVKPFTHVLDLACGHGQDLDKYNNKKIRKLLGIDISFREVIEARRRYTARKKYLKFNAEFHHGNILDEKIYNTFIKSQKFDVVSIQLAIHYILQDEASATFILEHIYKLLNDKGLFIGTTICCQQLAKALNNSTQFQNNDGETVWQFGNSIFRITLDDDSVKVLSNSMDDINITWGLKYHFFLMESIDESEYIVPWKSFVDLASKIGLRLIESCTFPEYMSNCSVNIERSNLQSVVVDTLNRHMKLISSFPLSNNQHEVFSLYKVFVFEKITGRDRLYMQGVKIKK